MTASLPMYDTAITGAANDRFWQLIRSKIDAGPEHLDRHTDPHATWLSPDLVLSQTCGLPYRTELHGKVGLIGTPDYGVADCPPGFYLSRIVVRRDDPRMNLADFRGAVLARNDKRSQSGWAAIENHLTQEALGFSFADNVVDTGAHLKSAQAVATHQADIAALDAVTWELLKRETDLAETLRVLTSTCPTPGLPFITARHKNPFKLFDAISGAIDLLTVEDRQCLMLKGIVAIPAAEYLKVSTP